jgi:hypothetical protein
MQTISYVMNADAFENFRSLRADPFEVLHR